MGTHTTLPHPSPWVWLPMLLLPLLACKDKDEGESGPEIIEDDDDDFIHLDDPERDSGNPEDCQSVTLKINGRAPEDTPDPAVGDHWMVRIYCDGIVLHGANRLFFAPPELATVEDHNTDADFLAAGEGLMTMQSGSERITLDITVLEAP